MTTVPPLSIADAVDRRRALDVTRSFIVQAPAGSGKTELLTQRFLALLATVDEPESVLAITFTRKSAGEMRQRILGALREARVPGTLEKPPTAETLRLAESVLRRDDARGWGLIGNPSRLRIQTIDSLNMALARRVPLLSGLGSGLGVEEDARPLYRLAAERLLGHLPGGEPVASDAVATVLEHLDNRVPAFVSLVVEMLERREAWLPRLPVWDGTPENDGELRQQLGGTRLRPVEEHLARLHADFPDDLLAEAAAVAQGAATSLASADVDSPIRAFADVARVPAEDVDDLSLWRGLAELFTTGSGTARVQFNKNCGIGTDAAGKALKPRAAAISEELARQPSLLRRLHEVRLLPPPAYDENEWTVLRAQLLVLRLAAAELENVFAERRSVDYSRFAAAARQALGTPDAPTDTALILDAQLRHVLVDEFQDTSEAQVKLLELLTAGWEPGDGRSLFLVGDPMQSIYRFRNAEVGLFLDIREKGLGSLRLEPLTLSVNFRSTCPIVDWVNEAFQQVLPNEDDALQGAVRFSASTPRPGAGTDGGVQVHPLFRRSRRAEATQIANIIRRRLEEEPQAKVAILVQGRAHLVDIVAELARAGLPFQATDIDPLARRPAVLDVLALTQAISHRADRTAWLSVLRAPWCGLELADLHTLCEGDSDTPVLDLVRHAQRHERLSADAKSRLARCIHVLGEALDELPRYGLRDTVERAWNALAGPATLLDARGLDEVEACFDRIADFEERSAGPLEFAAFREALEKLYAPSTPGAEVRIELMTIHKAKGLQFDTVIVPALERPPRGDDRRLLQWARLPDADRHEVVVAPVGATGGERNPLYAWLQRLEKERHQHERRRLLYVAATRAERSLHLFGSAKVKDGDDGLVLQKPSDDVALGMLWPVVGSRFETRLAELGRVDGEEGTEILREPVLRRLPPHWQPPDPPPGPEILLGSSIRGEAVPPPEFDWASETARHVGTVVHSELQLIAKGLRAQDYGAVSVRRRLEAELAELGVPVGRRRAAVDRAVEALERIQQDPRGRWLLDATHREAETELALSGRIGPDIVNVIVDRTFVDAEGVRWIVDYKTSTHEGGGLEAFLDNEQERYRPQLERYAALVAKLGPESVRLGLYFPLLSGWREWSPDA
jgi:ATP-dependent exoDNAse (exonuclease V) beta subunit